MKALLATAEEVWRKYPDRKTAMRVLIRALRADDQLCSEALAFAAQEALDCVRRGERQRIIKAQSGGGSASEDELSIIVSLQSRRTIGSWPLWNNVPLMKASYDDVARQIELHQGAEKGHGQRRRFFELVATHMDRSKSVGKSLSEQKLEALARSAGLYSVKKCA